jgi:hypothetical protein
MLPGLPDPSAAAGGGSNMGLFKKAGKVLKKAGKQLSQNVSHLPEVANQIGQFGALPIQMVAGSMTGVMSAAAPVLEQATGLLQANPLLGQALSAATGLPGGLFGGGQVAGGVESSGGMFTPAAPVAQQAERIPVWVWIAGGAAALVGAFLIFRKKA